MESVTTQVIFPDHVITKEPILALFKEVVLVAVSFSVYAPC